MITASFSSGYSGPPATYFERFTPDDAAAYPVVMLHGGGSTGACWQTTVDGRPGWLSRFLARGYEVYLPDWPGHGRSGALPADTVTGELVTDGIAAVIRDIGCPVILISHSMGGAFGWRVTEKCPDQIAAIVALAPGAPGNIQPDGLIVGARADEILVDDGIRQAWVRREGITIPGKEMAEVKLIGGSTQFPRELIKQYTRSLAPLASRLHYERLNVGRSQVRVSESGIFRGKPILVLTGSEDIDHSKTIDGGTVEWLQEAGAQAEHIWLADHGIVGNGHMLMMEDNSDQIADLALNWLDNTL